jgi:hypothetical protein
MASSSKQRRRRELAAQPAAATTLMTAATPTAPPNVKSVAVLGLILSCVAGPVGLIISLVALIRSRRIGERNAAALAGVIVGLVTTAAFIGGVIYFHAVLTGDIGVCAELGPGVQDGVNGTFTCPGA